MKQFSFIVLQYFLLSDVKRRVFSTILIMTLLKLLIMPIVLSNLTGQKFSRRYTVLNDINSVNIFVSCETFAFLLTCPVPLGYMHSWYGTTV